ncbi:MAG: hypothetical protein GF317_09875 [Candidatus Lokiarchaeota archaeon]|nr:hypothetical protein [Candidatus Lokiarchaeota archaeon]
MSNDNKSLALEDLKKIREIFRRYNINKQVCSVYFGEMTHSQGRIRRHMRFHTILTNNVDFATLNRGVDIDLDIILSKKLECKMSLPGDPKSITSKNTITIKIFHKLETRIPGEDYKKTYNFYTAEFEYTYLRDKTHLYIIFRGASLSITIEDEFSYLQITYGLDEEYNSDIWNNFWRDIREYFAIIRSITGEYTEEELKHLKLWGIEYDKTFFLKPKRSN